MPDSEKRGQQRFPLVVPANLSVTEDKRTVMIQLKTRDISSSGAFLESDVPIAVGQRVTVELFLTVRGLLELIRQETGARVRVCGRVIRESGDGFAVQFSKGYGIRPMSSPVKGWPTQ